MNITGKYLELVEWLAEDVLSGWNLGKCDELDQYVDSHMAEITGWVKECIKMKLPDRKTIADFQVIDHGVEHESYFQGCGVYGTGFTDIATGMGNNFAEAVGAALEMLSAEWKVDGLKIPDNDEVPKRLGDGFWRHVSIRVK